MTAAEVNKAIPSVLAMIPNIEQLKSVQEERLKFFITAKDVVRLKTSPFTVYVIFGKLHSVAFFTIKVAHYMHHRQILAIW